MIPSILSQQIHQGLKDFLSTTFHSTNPFFHGMLDRFLEEDGTLRNGPYISLQLPFQKGQDKEFFPHIPLGHTPYLHQELAFSRLSDKDPKPTLIAAGTGSGKTECFTWPILEHCRTASSRHGIKAILLYPMNALAYDQAGRLAETIWKTPGLQGKVTAGLFVGQASAEPCPTMPGINYEKIQKTKTPGFRSVRIGDEYRGVVLKPEHENVYVLLWVDHHDEAYAWARRKKCAVHPETGSLQIYETLEQTDLDLQAEAQPDSRATGLFDDIHDRHLRRFGVPEELLPRVRRIATQAELEALLHILPQEAYEALFFLSEGFSLQEVYQETGKSESEAEVDTTDILAALESPDSKQRFHVVSDDLELQSMLQAPLEKWRVFLHPTQRKLVERNWSGSVRVLGEAGTGKTVAAMHRAKWLARYVFTEPGDQILFTTFTRNLAADIQNNLRFLCSQEELERIQVVNLDKWVSDFLKRTGYISTIVYEQQTEPLWEQALAAAPEEPALTASFYREEWASVLQPQGVTTFAEYSKASRKGRGVPLSRKARKAVWPVFEEYRLLLNDQGWREPDDAMRDARHVLESKKMGLPYKAVIVDEAQDMGTQAFKLVRQMVPEGENDIFIVGDGHQRIYRHRVVLGQCGIKIVGRSRKLRINYRTTEETRRWATGVLKGLSIDNLDAEPDEEKGTTSLLRGVNPTIETFSSFDDECRYLTQVAREKETEGTLGTACLVTRTNAQKERYKRTLEDQGILTYSLTRSKAEDRTAPGLRLATMHRVKGLEFDTIIIAGANKGVMPLDMAMGSTSDPAEYEDKELRERALFYVAATRAKKDVIVTCSGTPSPFLER